MYNLKSPIYMDKSEILKCTDMGVIRNGRVVRWCSVNFQSSRRPTIWMIVGQGHTALAVGAGGVCLDIFTPSIFSLLFLPLSSFSLSLGDGPI